jgi:hypothetical protein
MRWKAGHVGMQYEQFICELFPQFYGRGVSLIEDSQKKCVTCSNKASISFSNWCLGEWVEEGVTQHRDRSNYCFFNF